MKEFLLSNSWIFGVFGAVITFLAINFKELSVVANSKLEDVIIWYAVVVLVYGSVTIWTDFFTWLLK